MWYEGRYKGYEWRAKAYDTSSKYGIDGGRISKLYVTDHDRCVVIYFDRKWVDRPTRENGKWMEDFLEYFDRVYCTL